MVIDTIEVLDESNETDNVQSVWFEVPDCSLN